ncbi:MAG TPA: 30S ribosomal protein S16 [Firmicutes bacterium]|nr:30S ribosomal protein S16 [Bacillota bacterium]
MAVRIRLMRMGAKKQPSYRVVVADSRSRRDGRFIELLGHYNPGTNPATIKIDEEKTRGWLAKGALPSDAVKAILAQAGIMERVDQRRSG